MAITNQAPPDSTEDELAEYLSRFRTEVVNAFAGKDIIQGYTAIPSVLQVGKVYYFHNAIAAHPTITAEGWYGYKSTGWVLIA